MQWQLLHLTNDCIVWPWSAKQLTGTARDSYFNFLAVLLDWGGACQQLEARRFISTVAQDKQTSVLCETALKKQVAQRATIAHLSPMCQGHISFQKIWTHPSFNACSCYMKVSKGSNQKQQRKSGNTIFPIIRSMGVFLRRSRAANSGVGGPIWPKFELIHNIMHVLATSKFEKDRININRDYVMTSIF